MTATLPAIDEHSTIVDADASTTDLTLRRVVDGAFGGRAAQAYARLIRCRPAAPGGPRPLAVGSDIVGFTVTASWPGEVLELTGRHAFSQYRLTFTIEPDGDRSRVTARTEATFPGPHGWLYQTAVVRSRGHVLAVNRMLRAVKAQAERG